MTIIKATGGGIFHDTIRNDFSRNEVKLRTGGVLKSSMGRGKQKAFRWKGNM